MSSNIVVLHPQSAAEEAAIDLSYRPDTYWPASLDEEQRLARIPGFMKRHFLRKLLAEDHAAGLKALAAEEVFAEAGVKIREPQFPAFLGGEFLPALGEDDVEIARISLASTTFDQITIRAAKEGDRIRYAVYDEYATVFELSRTHSDLPLTLEELIAFIDGSNHPDERFSGGLLMAQWRFMVVECSYEPEGAVGFASIESAWYPELANYYAGVADEWCAELRDDWDDFDE